MRAPKAGRVYVVWTDPHTKRTRRYGEPLEELAERQLEAARDYLARAYNLDGDEAAASAVESARIHRGAY